MKNVTYIILLGFLLACCNKSMDDINTNPDKPTIVPPKYLATKAILAITENANGKTFLPDEWLMKTIASNEMGQSHMYNSLSSSGIDYTLLINTKKMIELAEKDNSISEEVKNAYRALDHFTKAWQFYLTTMDLGDVPCSEALKGEGEGLTKPAYDTQEAVFATILALLDEASDLFSKGKTFDGDPIYKGDPGLWQKTCNGFMLKVLLQLSNKTQVGSYNVRQKFEEVAKRPLYAGTDEDFQRTYSNKAGQYYPFNKLNHNFTGYMFMQKYIVDMLQKYEDRRLFYYAEPAEKLLADGHKEDSFEAYSGVDGTQVFENVENETKQGIHSRMNIRYSQDPVCEPIKKISYFEIQFILAEASLKGWDTPMAAENHYNEAVSASLKFTYKYTLPEYRHKVAVDDAYISDYLATKANFVTAADKLDLLLEQKFIASFMQLKWNKYFDYRRTGYPKIPINAETSQNVDHKDRMPVRWTYPKTEYDTNFDNIEAAIQRQFGGNVETQNDVMWLLK